MVEEYTLSFPSRTGMSCGL